VSLFCQPAVADYHLSGGRVCDGQAGGAHRNCGHAGQRHELQAAAGALSHGGEYYRGAHVLFGRLGYSEGHPRNRAFRVAAREGAVAL
nr:hypothetical protein [Tanacetum cinerariifolium]